MVHPQSVLVTVDGKTDLHGESNRNRENDVKSMLDPSDADRIFWLDRGRPGGI